MLFLIINHKTNRENTRCYSYPWLLDQYLVRKHLGTSRAMQRPGIVLIKVKTRKIHFSQRKVEPAGGLV